MNITIVPDSYSIPPSRVEINRLFDFAAPGIYDFQQFDTVTGGDAFKSFYNVNRGSSNGIATSVSHVTGALTARVPFQSPFKFATADPVRNCNPSYEWGNGGNDCELVTWLRGNGSGAYYRSHHYYGGGPDFSMIYFLCTPVILSFDYAIATSGNWTPDP